MKQLAKYNKAIFTAIAILAIILSVVSMARTHHALSSLYQRQDMTTRIELAIDLFHDLDKQGYLTNKDKLALIPIYDHALTSLMDNNLDDADFYLEQAGTLITQMAPNAFP